MKKLVIGERVCLISHIVSMVFGLVGILWVVPNAGVVLSLSEAGQTVMQWSMAGGGVVYMILGAAAVFLYAARNFGLGRALAFFLPSVLISLTSELLGTSTGFPFGQYSYLSGLGYKIADLVPFTIPLFLVLCGMCFLSASSHRLRSGSKTNLVTSFWGNRLRSITTDLLGFCT